MSENISEKTIVRRTLIIAGIIIVVFLFALLIHFALKILLMIFTGALLAILYRGCAFWLGSKLNINPQKIVPFVILFHVGISLLTIILLSPRISEQITVLSEELPRSIKALQEQFFDTRVGGLVERNLPKDGNMAGGFDSFFQTIVGFFVNAIGVLIDILLIYVFALFLSINPTLYKNGFIRLFPVQRRERIAEVWDKVSITLFKWFLGMIVDMTSIFIMTAIALWLLDVPLVLTLALIAFIFSFVPNVGPVLSAIPAVLIAFTQEPILGLYVLLAYLGIQMLESYLITPNIQKRAINLAPLLLLSFQLIMASFAGIFGLFISTPLLAALIVVIKCLYVEDTLEKGTAAPHVSSGHSSGLSYANKT
ncbi:MAG: AI-2E family transporter [Bacteroidota bacterium]|nr:AI-2E family transporter [Bacteroidota bacterium]